LPSASFKAQFFERGVLFFAKTNPSWEGLRSGLARGESELHKFFKENLPI
jgi:hypothetical protein